MHLVANNHLRPAVVPPEQRATALQLVPRLQLLQAVEPAAVEGHAGWVAHDQTRSRNSHACRHHLGQNYFLSIKNFDQYKSRPTHNLEGIE